MKDQLRTTSVFLFLFLLSIPAFAQQSSLGAWYMYFGGVKFGDSPIGLHAEAQYRNHNLIGDMEQLLLRTGIKYTTKGKGATFTLGYGYIQSEAEGKPNFAVPEHRIYQEALLHQQLGILKLNHRYRFEQRFIENQDFRTRFRYNLFVNVPLTKKRFRKNGLYLAFYDEIFINGQKKPGIEYFDRNRLYGGLGYKVKDDLAVQLGYMEQTLNNRSKGQLQFSLHYLLPI